MVPEEMRQLAEERRRLAESHGPLLAEVSAVLFRHDPIGINFEDNTDEYEAEASTILKRMGAATSPTEARRIVHEEFVRWFEPEIAGPVERYTDIASEVLAAYHQWGCPDL
jgi:hypothetical protein